MIKILAILALTLLITACSQKSLPSPTTLKKNRVIFIGEYHDNYAHHQNQKRLITKLYESGAKIAIGMEMFQKPFQKVLDDYINGKIDEITMLKQSEYFSRWGYDYTFYRPIMIYAKTHHIPIIALNLPREISKKISKNGLSSLTPKERNNIPKNLDFSDKAYKKRLLKIFNDPDHLNAVPKKYRPNLDYFYQAQILWDESMAKSIATYLNSHPDTIMIALTGNGHLAYYVGIPNRVKRRVHLPMQVILQDSDKAPGKADAYLYPKAMKIEGTPKLGVSLSPKDLKVLSVSKDSLAQKMGIKKGDRLITCGNMPVKSLADLKLALYLYADKKPFYIKVKRGDKEIKLP